MDDPKPSYTAAAASGPGRRLESWKEIAAHLKRDIRTVQRWERLEGLPVHRHFHSRQSTVYAFQAEVEAWWEKRRARLDAQSPEGPRAAELSGDGGPPAGGTPALPVSDQPAALNPWGVHFAARTARTRGAGLLLAVAAFLGAVTLMAKTPSGSRLLRDLTGWFRPAKAASKAQPARAQAEALYLQGRYYWNKRSATNLNTAVDYFTQAIVHDPGYAPAYVGLADCYNLLREYGTMPDREAFPRALAAAKKAVELDDTSADAHTSLAFASFYGAWDAVTADHEFSRAIELDPANVRAHHWHATFLMTVGRSQEAIAEITRAQELDPASPAILADKGLILFYAGRLDEALAVLRRMEQEDAAFMSPHRYLSFISLATGDYPGYLAEARQMARLAKDSQELELVEAQEKGWAQNGAQGMLESTLHQQNERFRKGSMPAYTLAQTFAQLGRRQEAMEYLQTAYRQHEVNLLTVRIDPTLASLRREPAYRELLARVYPTP